MSANATEIFKVLSVESRVKIIELLKTRGPLGAKEIGETIGITTAAVSQHLKLLRQTGLVKNERKGYWIPYSIDEKAMDHCRKLVSEVCSCGCQKTGISSDNRPRGSTLASLKNYEKALMDELEIVRRRVKAIEAQNS
jgi:DNA-binding transcriptional ArsR family regulator